MLSNCPEYYGTSRIFKAYLQTIGLELDASTTGVGTILDAFFVKTAPEWSLSIWERELAIIPGFYDTVNLRRAMILAKLAGTPTMTLEQMKRIVNQFVHEQTATVENIPNEYVFKIIIPVDDVPWFTPMNEAVEEYKPAHLESLPVLRAIYQGSESLEARAIFISAINICGNRSLLWDGTCFFDGSQNFTGYISEPNISDNRSLLWDGTCFFDGNQNFTGYISDANICDNRSLLWDGTYFFDGSQNFTGCISATNGNVLLQLIVGVQNSEIAAITLITQHDFWFFDGSGLFDGSREFNAYETTEVL